MEKLKTAIVNLLKFIGVLIGCAVFVLVCFVAFGIWYTSQPQKPTTPQVAITGTQLDECDHNLRLNVRYRETLKIDWTYQAFDRIDRKRIKRGFVAKNVYGTEVRATYYCDVIGNNVVKFFIEE